jgi:replicative DNA helicase
MQGRNPSQRIAELERKILRALCRCLQADEGSERALRELESFQWHEPEHQVIYEALEAVLRRGETPARESLATQATRMGFPAIDWATYFKPAESQSAGAAARELPRLLRELKAAARGG